MIYADFSPDRLYRYALWRDIALPDGVASRGSLLFIMLNPSTADETENDPTVRRCIDFARRWGFAQLKVMNLFAFRSTDPRALLTCPDPIGASTDIFMGSTVATCARIVCAWGDRGLYYGRGAIVAEQLRSNGLLLHHLGLTAKGMPRHPLYVRADKEPVEWLAS